jgi:hypothetical protein
LPCALSSSILYCPSVVFDGLVEWMSGVAALDLSLGIILIGR